MGIRKTALQVFEELYKEENRIPTKAEWETRWFGRPCKRNENNYYYVIKKKWLNKQESDSNEST